MFAAIVLVVTGDTVRFCWIRFAKVSLATAWPLPRLVLLLVASACGVRLTEVSTHCVSLSKRQST